MKDKIISSIIIGVLNLFISLMLVISVFKLLWDKWLTNEIVFTVLFFLCLIIVFTIYCMFTIYPLCLNLDTRLSLFCEKHIFSFYAIGMVISITFASLNSRKIFSEEQLSNLINLQWVIFGITALFYTLWNTNYLSKERKKLENPDNFIGAERIKAIRDIRNNIMDNSISFSLILLLMNILVLIMATALFYIFKLELKAASYVNIISFFFCTNTLICIFGEVLIPMLKQKKEISEEYREIDLKIDKDKIALAAVEEVSYQYLEKSLETITDLELKKKAIEIGKKAIIDFRNSKKDSNNESNKESKENIVEKCNDENQKKEEQNNENEKN